MKLIRRNGEWWQIRPAKRGWVATCDALDGMRVTAATEAALMLQIDEVMELLLV